MARRRIKTISEDEFSQYMKLNIGYADLAHNEAAWNKIPKLEQVRYERDFYALSVKLYHTLGFKDKEAEAIERLKTLQDEFEVYQELVLAEDKALKEKYKAKLLQERANTLNGLARLKREDPKKFYEYRRSCNQKTSFRDTYTKLNKINK